MISVKLISPSLIHFSKFIIQSLVKIDDIFLKNHGKSSIIDSNAVGISSSTSIAHFVIFCILELLQVSLSIHNFQ